MSYCIAQRCNHVKGHGTMCSKIAALIVQQELTTGARRQRHILSLQLSNIFLKKSESKLKKLI